MDLMDLYSTNADFKSYVDKYANLQGISTVEALSHAMVRSYADYLAERGMGEKHG